MSSNEKKLNIKDAINLSNYPLSIRRDFVEFLENTYGSQKHKLYLFSRNETAPKIFLFQMQIPAKFNNQSYERQDSYEYICNYCATNEFLSYNENNSTFKNSNEIKCENIENEFFINFFFKKKK